MNYSKESFKYKIKKEVNKIIIVLVTLIFIFFAFVNVKSYYYLNKTYKISGNDYNNFSRFDELKNNINIIKNNQGKYSNEDYSLILEYLSYEDVLKDAEKYFNKNNYFYKEINSAYFDLYNYYDIAKKGEKVYKLLVKYDYNIIDNLNSYYSFYDSYNSSLNIIRNLIDNPYHINNGTSSYNILSINGAIAFKYFMVKALVNDIIEAGDINE